MYSAHVHIIHIFLDLAALVAMVYAEDLLTVPPGFSEGIIFNKKEPSLTDVSSPQTISIADLMAADEWLVPAVVPEKKEEVDGGIAGLTRVSG